MTALIDDPVFEVVAEWWLPTDPDPFLAWLASSGVPGDTDQERIDTFMGYGGAARYMPTRLKSALGIAILPPLAVAWDGELRSS